jgi:hypothetical protein
MSLIEEGPTQLVRMGGADAAPHRYGYEEAPPA